MLGQTLLRKYKVVRPLDEGGMCKIYLAKTIVGDREVAIKVLKDQYASNRKHVEHFRREIHILMNFKHPNSVAAIDASPNEATGPVLVMEYLRGIDLHGLMHRDGRFTLERANRLLSQLCEALQAAHTEGLIHCDVKPGNLMILYPGTPQETLKLMDFGLARMVSMLYIAPDELGEAGIPLAAGTPEYICPEQVLGQQMDHRADLYSAGVVLFEMIAGRRLFQHSNVQDLMRAHAVEPPPSFASLGLEETISPDVEKVVRECLSKHPEGRPASASELARRFSLAACGKALMPRSSPGFSLGRPPSTPGSGLIARPPLPTKTDPNTVQHKVEAAMPEAMAVVKLKGFLFDLGGEILESVPGMLKARLPDPNAKRGGLLGWFDGGRKSTALLQEVGASDIELRMERLDPNNSTKLTVTLQMRPVGRNLMTPEWRKRCAQIGRDLQAYLMGR